MNYTKSEIWVGAVVLIGAALLVGAVVTVLNVQAVFQPKARLLVRYQNVKGLKPGAVVQLSGVPVGTVSDVRLFSLDLATLSKTEIQRLKDLGWVIPPRRDPLGTWETTAVGVTIEMPARYAQQVHPNSLVVVVKSLTGQVVIDIEYGGGTREPWQGEPFWGAETTLFTDAARELGIGDEQRDNLRSILRSADTLATNLSTFSGSLQAIDADDFGKAKKWIRETLEHVSAASKSIHALVDAEKGDLPKMVADLRETVNSIRDSLKQTMVNVESASGKINTFMDEANRFADNLNATLTREALRRVVDNVRQASQSLKDVIASAKGTVTSLHDLVGEHRPTIRRIVENVEDATSYLRLTLKDLSRRPWKLVKGPGAEDDTEAADLYRALREFNQGASDLELVSQQLRAVLSGHASPSKDRDEMIRRLQRRLDHVSKNFQKLEEQLWKKMGRTP